MATGKRFSYALIQKVYVQCTGGATSRLHFFTNNPLLFHQFTGFTNFTADKIPHNLQRMRLLLFNTLLSINPRVEVTAARLFAEVSRKGVRKTVRKGRPKRSFWSFSDFEGKNSNVMLWFVVLEMPSHGVLFF